MAVRQGKASCTMGEDFTELVAKNKAREQANRTYLMSCLEKAFLRIKELKMAGMINKVGEEV